MLWFEAVAYGPPACVRLWFWHLSGRGSIILDDCPLTFSCLENCPAAVCVYPTSVTGFVGDCDKGPTRALSNSPL